MTQKPHTFHIHGMHCAACVLLTENELSGLPNISRVKSNLQNHSVEVSGDFSALGGSAFGGGDPAPEIIAEELTLALSKHGYRLSVEKEIKNKNWSDFKIAIPIAIAFALLFVILQKIGLVNLVDTSKVSYGTAFVVGIIASLSTCMAVVGGLVLSISATFAKEGDKIKPQLLFHGGRLISFFILGGVIGAIGSAFTLNTAATFILNLIIGLVMLILGLNLLEVVHFSKKFQPAMPKFLARHAFGLTKLNHSLTPLLVGVATFFLPCGFTQSMQIFTLSTGSFIRGGLTMLTFALGTLPVLALVSFSSFSIKNSSTAGVFFKTAGLVVITFALFDLINSLVVVGVLPPVFNF